MKRLSRWIVLSAPVVCLICVTLPAKAQSGAVPTEPRWCAAARRPATPVARAATAKAKNSDASGIPGHGDPVHRGGQSRHPEPTDRCKSLRARTTPQNPSTARALRVLRGRATRLDSSATVALERMSDMAASRGSPHDLACRRGGDPAPVSR